MTSFLAGPPPPGAPPAVGRPTAAGVDIWIGVVWGACARCLWWTRRAEGRRVKKRRVEREAGRRRRLLSTVTLSCLFRVQRTRTQRTRPNVLAHRCYRGGHADRLKCRAPQVREDAGSVTEVDVTTAAPPCGARISLSSSHRLSPPRFPHRTFPPCPNGSVTSCSIGAWVVVRRKGNRRRENTHTPLSSPWTDQPLDTRSLPPLFPFSTQARPPSSSPTAWSS